uniref:Amino acid transporter transmembrane domain-containing protein n=1 Tax=Emiliania huxleyi TaxID=2903 RepID=A0A7S3W674_EMIHU
MNVNFSSTSLFTIYSELDHDEQDARRAWLQDVGRVVKTSGPLLLAISGSALLPLPCAFGQAGIPGASVLLVLTAAANDYTTILMVRAASRLGVSSYEEAVLGSAGRAGLVVARVSLVVLLFGTLCGNLSAISETAERALVLAGWTRLAARHDVLLAGATVVVMPLSLLQLGEMGGISLFGLAMMVALLGYLAHACLHSHAALRPHMLSPQPAALPTAASTFGYALYVQPCVPPLLRSLPPGEQGRKTLERAAHLTFGVSALFYLLVGCSGLLLFDTKTPQNALQGFSGESGALLSGCFSLYLALCFAPIAAPLRETLVRLAKGSTAASIHTSELYRESLAGSPPLVLNMHTAPAELPPLSNALVTAFIVGAAHAVARLLPNASASIFAFTGATGVAMVACPTCRTHTSELTRSSPTASRAHTCTRPCSCRTRCCAAVPADLVLTRGAAGRARAGIPTPPPPKLTPRLPAHSAHFLFYCTLGGLCAPRVDAHGGPPPQPAPRARHRLESARFAAGRANF